MLLNFVSTNTHLYSNSNSTVYSFDILSGKRLWFVPTKVLEFYPGVR